MLLLIILLYVAGFSAYAYRDWFRSLCALLLLTAVLEHPILPRTMWGIQGLNPWNVLLLNVVLAWWWQRRRRPTAWDAPGWATMTLTLYLVVVGVAFARMISDRGGIEEINTASLVSDYLINALKWLIPAWLLFDGARTRERLAWGLGCTLAAYVVLAFFTIGSVPVVAASSGVELTRQTRALMRNSVGYHPTTMSVMLAGAAWAILAAAIGLRSTGGRAAAVVATAVVMYAQALTAGRMGYLTWVAVGGILCALRRHKLFLVAPVLALAALLVVKGAGERMAQDVFRPAPLGHQLRGDVSWPTSLDYDKISSGRLTAWHLVVEKIRRAPWIGYGRLAMARTGLAQRIRDEYRDSFPHPHNAYLEWLLDNGLLGLLAASPFYALLVVQAARSFRSPDASTAAVGGATLALVLALLIGALSGQTFYPREATIGMWACIGLLLCRSAQADIGAARR